MVNELNHDDCIFCDIESFRKIDEDDLFYVIRDGFPVTALHTLIIPNRHVETYFELTEDEVLALNLMINKHKQLIEEKDPTVSGFNIGMNCGEDAGQTVFHCHIHLIPRRKGDVDVPRGGVRHLIPGKGTY
jgi:diadenosine tetraphosphate (Ap4A) HIT family hydrolase